MAALTTLVLGTESPEAQLVDVDFARWLEYGEGKVVRFDPEAAYRRGGMRCLEHEVLRVVAEQQVGILVYPIGMEFDFRPSFLSEALPSVYRVLLVGDDEHYFEVSHRYYAQGFDMVWSTNPLHERYRACGVPTTGFIPGAFSPRIYHPIPGTKKDIDVSFVGAMRGKVGRREYAEALARSGIAFQAFGAGSTAGVVSRAQVVDVFRKSRINLNFTGGALKTPLDAHVRRDRHVRQIKGRCPMIALCGSFVLSEHAPGIEKLFAVGSEIDVFDSGPELIEKVRFYLVHEEQREAMAQRAHQRALREYDEAIFGRRFAAELQSRAQARERRAAGSPRLDREFWAGFGAWRMKYLVIFLFAARPILFLRELWVLLRAGHCRPYAAVWFAAMGLLVAARTSPLAAWLSRAARRARQSWRQPQAGHG